MKEKRYFLERRSFPVKAALVCLLLAFVLRGISGFLNRVVLEDKLTLFSFLMFLGSCLLYALSLLLFGKKWLWLTTGTFVLGIMAFVSRLFTFDNLLQEEVSILRMMISILYYLVVTAVYAGTVCGGLRGKWFLVLLFMFPLAGHIVFDIIPAFRQGAALSAVQILAELSVLFVIIGMIFTALGMRHVGHEYHDRKKKEKEAVPPPAEKPDEKPPVVSDAVQQKPVSENGSEHVPEPELPEETAYAAALEMPSAVESNTAEVSEEEGYDPFAPSTEPIRLTLDPVLGDDNSETDTEETNAGESGSKKDEHAQA